MAKLIKKEVNIFGFSYVSVNEVGCMSLFGFIFYKKSGKVKSLFGVVWGSNAS